MSGCVPDKQGVFPFKVFDLLVKQPVIRGKSRKEDQLRGGVLRFLTDPVMNYPAGRLVCPFNHFWIPRFDRIGIFDSGLLLQSPHNNRRQASLHP